MSFNEPSANKPSLPLDLAPTPSQNQNASSDNGEYPNPIQNKGHLKRWKMRTCWAHFKLHFNPPKKVANAPGFWRGISAIVFGSYLNILLICIPLSWAFHFALEDDFVLVFVFSFLAIIPLAKLLAIATDELSLRVGQTLAGLLNATLGNAVEIIVAIIAIVKCELQVVQSSLIGSILSNLLLVLGMCFFAGGIKYSEQGFGGSATQINSSLLTISVIAVLLPAAFHQAVSGDPDNPNDGLLNNGAEGRAILKMSHGVAIILLFIYASYLVFQLWSHSNLYDDGVPGNFHSTKYPLGLPGRHNLSKLRRRYHPKTEKVTDPEACDGPANDAAHVESDPQAALALERSGSPPGATGSTTTAPSVRTAHTEEMQEPKMSLAMCIGLLIVVTVLVAVTAEFLVDSIDGVTASGVLSKEWVGLILLPIVGNAAEHVTAVSVSYKDKLTLSIGVAVGSSIQIALFVIPLSVIIAWILNKPLLLLFDPFESVTVFLAVLTVNYCTQDGKSNWLEGMILMCLYVIIAVSFWFYPGSDIGQALAACT